jgi:hypothetical protein
MIPELEVVLDLEKYFVQDFCDRVDCPKGSYDAPLYFLIDCGIPVDLLGALIGKARLLVSGELLLYRVGKPDINESLDQLHCLFPPLSSP